MNLSLSLDEIISQQAVVFADQIKQAAAFASKEMERELKSESAAAGREAAIARGQSGGRPRTDPKKLEQATILYDNSKQTAAEVCKAVGVGRRTFFRYLSRKREKEKAER